LFAGSLVGLGSAVFHPESSRVARLASGGQHGLAQSLFQGGGHAGSALGPLLVLLLVLSARNTHAGQHRIAWFSAAALLAIGLLIGVGQWYKTQLRHGAAAKEHDVSRARARFARGTVRRAM